MKKITTIAIILLAVFAVLTACKLAPNEPAPHDNPYDPDYVDPAADSVTYNGNGANSGTVPIDSAVYQEYDTVTVLGNTGNLVKTGYLFTGWSTALDGTGTDYVEGNTFDMPEKKVTLYALWLEDLSGISYRDMITVTGGIFVQHDTSTNSFSHTISTFQMAQYEVTYKLWYTVRKWALASGYTFSSSGTEGNDGTTGGEPTAAYKYEPVTTINWRDAIVWCNAYSELEGYTPVYVNENYLVIKDSRDSNETECDTAIPFWNNNGYRLPTEGEWQYAASYQDGTNWTPYNWASGAIADYNNADATGVVAWYSINSSSTNVVGTKNANQIDIYDMSGNVREWCWDWDAAWPASATTNYRGAGTGTERVIRGGSYYHYASYLQVGYRYENNPEYGYYYAGFRLSRKAE